MARFACGVEYDGFPFHGWQYQAHAPSIQQELEQALTQIADHPVSCAAAGRTDAGVHATGQVVHFDTTAARETHSWQRGAGSILPDTISISWVRSVPADFHARHSAQRRHYRYIFLPQTRDTGLLAHRVTCTARVLDAARMHEAAQALLGKHDFSSFRAASCQAHSPVRTVHRLEVCAHGPFVHVDIEADGFLHHMVRILAGVLAAVGSGDRGAEWPAELLRLRDRTAGGVTAPAGGLYLVRVHYPEEYAIPVPPWTPHYGPQAPRGAGE